MGSRKVRMIPSYRYADQLYLLRNRGKGEDPHGGDGHDERRVNRPQERGHPSGRLAGKRTGGNRFTGDCRLSSGQDHSRHRRGRIDRRRTLQADRPF